MLNGLSLFSGIGGLDVALSEWVRPVAYIEIDPYCQAVLLSRMRSLHLPNAPIWTDITSFSEAEFKVFRGFVHILYGGFPCQDISIAGLGKGLAGERSGLFFEIVRLAKEIKPSFLFLENTKGILSNGGVEVINALTSIGYSCRWITKSCKEVGSPQSGERWFCLAYSDGKRLQEKRLARKSESKESQFKLHLEYSFQEEWPQDKSPLLRMDDELPYWVDRVKCLDNSVCINQTREAFKELIGLV